MDKSNEKKSLSYNAAVIKALIEEFEVTGTFIRQCIRKERHSRTAQNIEKKYHEMANATLLKVKQFKQQQI
jgi:hypothetical protein